MTLALLLRMAGVFAMLSVVSIGGINALLPELRRQTVVVEGWMSDAAFAHAFAIATAAPGPNVILVSLIGWRVAGPAGLFVATLAIALPSCVIAYVAAVGLARWPNSAALGRVKAGLAPLALGLIFAGGVSMIKLADRTALDLVLTLGAAAFVTFTSRNPLWAVAVGALIAIMARHT